MGANEHCLVRLDANHRKPASHHSRDIKDEFLEIIIIFYYRQDMVFYTGHLVWVFFYTFVLRQQIMGIIRHITLQQIQYV